MSLFRSRDNLLLEGERDMRAAVEMVMPVKARYDRWLRIYRNKRAKRFRKSVHGSDRRLRFGHDTQHKHNSSTN